MPASILARLPLRFDYDDSYFDHPFQGMPADGYTPIVEAILDHPTITVELGRPVSADDLATYDHAFWTGPIDAFFGFDQGRLAYRTLDFEEETHDGDFQGCPVMNYCDRDVPYTRITEHKHFAPWETHESTVTFREFSRSCGPDDIPYYPVRLVDDRSVLDAYVERASSTTGVSFLGRLGTYRYLDMDVTIKEALDAADAALSALHTGSPVPAFFIDPSISP